MFHTVLIANRGTIAVRIIRTLKTMGIRAVAVYAEDDSHSLHVRLADQAFSLGSGPAKDTYLNQDKLMQIIAESGAQAVHPGYGFLSENAEFVARCEQLGVVFLGPNNEQMAVFGLKHSARALAKEHGVPLSPGTDLLHSLDSALQASDGIGYPVMLKSTAGGGGIGMQRCNTPSDLTEAFDRVQRLAMNNFSDSGVFVEKFIPRARHIEVQIFGDGLGGVMALGERDCSAQRRNQKVIEETPAPNLSDEQRQSLQEYAVRLGKAVKYRSAGTVEFVLDADTQQFYFLEVNTRLQVEHGVTEMVYGVDIVRWMVELGAGCLPPLAQLASSLKPSGHAVQARIYAEDPGKAFQPCTGVLSQVAFPASDGVRIDSWVDSGCNISGQYDPMIAKVIGYGADRVAAIARLEHALQQTCLYGVENNLHYVQQILSLPSFEQGEISTASLADMPYNAETLDIVSPGTLTTVQSFPGRTGYWHIGVPPSGPFDSCAHRLGNRVLGNPEDAAGLEITLQGPTIRFNQACAFVLTGAELSATLNGKTVPMWQVVNAEKGQVLQTGKITGGGMRAYLSIAGGLACPEFLGSTSTFTLGQFGGHAGRALQTGDVLKLKAPHVQAEKTLPAVLRPAYGHEWLIRVVYGPHGAPEFFTPHDIDTFFQAQWQVHFHSNRTGIRLIGPKPEWARTNGGEAGMHPSNIHDNAYAFGTIDFTGDMPVILGPDGPSLGGFVCPATVIHADLWILGQLKAGDKIRFIPVSPEQADEVAQHYESVIQTTKGNWPVVLDQFVTESALVSPILHRIAATEEHPQVCYRAAGDRFLLIEYGPLVLDIGLRFRVHALMAWLEQHPLAGILECTPGIRSLQIHFDSTLCTRAALLHHLLAAEAELGNLNHAKVASRTVYLPLSWDDEVCREAIDKYTNSVRSGAPWAPSNIEFIRRINGLDSIEAVKDIIFSASYLVMGLGDVYLGAPVATPVDPRHRLVTTKYNPARTWTAENSVGIGGAYMCVYGMEGPGGYQLVGRTLQMWNRDRQTEVFEQPWLLRFFDQIRFYPVTHEELANIRKKFLYGAYELRIEHGEFSLQDYLANLAANQEDIRAFELKRQTAFEEELAHWHQSGQFTFDSCEAETGAQEAYDADEGFVPVESPVSGSLCKWLVQEGDAVAAEQPICVLEAMKVEFEICATASGVIQKISKTAGQSVTVGQALLWLLLPETDETGYGGQI